MTETCQRACLYSLTPGDWTSVYPHRSSGTDKDLICRRSTHLRRLRPTPLPSSTSISARETASIQHHCTFLWYRRCSFSHSSRAGISMTGVITGCPKLKTVDLEPAPQTCTSVTPHSTTHVLSIGLTSVNKDLQS